MVVRTLAVVAPALLLLGCPPKDASEPGKGSNVEITDLVHVDAGVVSGGGEGTPVQPGSAEDVLGRVFVLGTEPSVPAAFGKLRAFMSRADASKARPTDWGTAWTHVLADEPGVIVGAGDPEGKEDPIEQLDVTFDQAGSAWRLEAAWGKPDLRAYDKSASCWLATSSKLKACHVKLLGHDVVALVDYVLLDDALAKGSPRALTTLVGRLGQSRAELQRAFPQHVTITDATDPTMNRVEVAFPATEYMASGAPDRILFYLDAKDHAHSISVRFGASDPDLRPALVKEVRAAADRVSTLSDAPSVTVLEGEPLDVVVVLDRAAALP